MIIRPTSEVRGDGEDKMLPLIVSGLMIYARYGLVKYSVFNESSVAVIRFTYDFGFWGFRFVSGSIYTYHVS